MTDILDLDGWNTIDRRIIDGEYEIEAEYTIQPDACTKGPYFDDKPEEGMELLCSGCYVRFHTERTSGHSIPSTP